VLAPGEAKTEHQWVPEILQVELPVEPEGECDPDVQEKVANFVEKSELGHSLNQNLLNLKSFRNPNIFTKLIEVFDIREYGSNFPPETHVDLYSLPQESFYDELWKAQKVWNEQRERERAKRTEISFVGSKAEQASAIVSTAAPPVNPRGPIGRAAGVARMMQSRMTGGIFSGVEAKPTSTSTAAASAAATTTTAAPKRKSKWDEPAPSPSSTGSPSTAATESVHSKKQKTE